jgi:alpha-beta hydrolase superfamily lysophospholipase
VSTDREALRRAALLGAVGGVASAAAAVAAATALATYFARRVVTPELTRVDDARVIEVGQDSVTLTATEETVAPGRYGLWLHGGRGHARVGEVIERDDAGRVTRVLLGVDTGHLAPGPVRWNQYYYAGDPAGALGLRFTEETVPSLLGPLPCWRVPSIGGGGPRWAVLVHGRGATRQECLRALPVLHRLGYTSLVVSYRNDVGAPRSAAGRYHLGDLEWQDVEAAVLHAAEGGAKEVVLVGWSMGGAIALQTVARSWTRDRVRGLVLDAPVLDWRDVLAHHARLNRLPATLGRLGQTVLTHRTAWRLAGVEAPVNLNRLDWVSQASRLSLPMLLLHSQDDEFVPFGPSRALAAARPDLVTFVPSRGARHTKEWNVDPDGWDAAVARFLLNL